MRVNPLTAVHVLRYLLAEAGYEEPFSELKSVWPLFLRFLALPAEGEDIASFQVRWAEGGEASQTLVLSCARQLTTAEPEGIPYTRLVAIELMYEAVFEAIEPEEF